MELDLRPWPPTAEEVAAHLDKHGQNGVGHWWAFNVIGLGTLRLLSLSLEEGSLRVQWNGYSFKVGERGSGAWCWPAKQDSSPAPWPFGNARPRGVWCADDFGFRSDRYEVLSVEGRFLCLREKGPKGAYEKTFWTERAV